MGFWQAVASWAESCPNNSAVIAPSGKLTFSQLAGRAHRLARTLKSYDQQRIGILTRDPITMAVGFHGTSLAGKTLVVLDPSWPQALLESMLGNLACKLVITDYPNRLDKAGLADPLVISEEPDRSPWELHEHENERELLIICTSGSTARPKAISRTAYSWLASLAAGAAMLMAPEEAVTLSPGPISHGLGLYSLIESIHTGGTFIGAGHWRSEVLDSLLSQVSCNRIVSVPTILDRLSTHLEPQHLSNIRWVISGGETLPVQLVSRLQALPALESCIEYFGSSEHSLIAYALRDTTAKDAGCFSGRLFPGVSVHFHDVDPDTGSGAAYIDSPYNANGYDPATAPPIARCGNSTSILDQGMQSDDGTITFMRREDGMLNLNGNNIHPSEIKDVLAILNILDAKVQVERQNGHARLIVHALSPAVDSGLLHKRFFELLPTFKVPHEIIFHKEWPLSFSGKSTAIWTANAMPEPLTRIRLR
ncbi:acyl--CoA ligase [Glutamicibacter sp. JL.03c]|uniref:class I adenylate-forming enzyme family protein n=1 Tax=Glutamicibacter sp. JL.03c TaxID=2984842 RepID=UPI0021F7F993|nr:class I adenylate-forming enzyme family protein [Glutamicibacter sp. JL.03c]UYQ76203.1 acyl--CoA ligase [Glutamicibacter sp. JL.03c]